MFRTFEMFTYVAKGIWRNDSNHGQRVRRLFMFAGWQFWKRVIRAPVIVPVFNGFRFVAYPDCQVSSGFIYYRVPDYEEITFIRKHINGGMLIDVGANVGSVSILLADKVQHAILFEPNPVAAERARENLAVNRLPFQVHELALSDASDTVRLEDEGGVSGTNRTVVGFETNIPTRLVSRVTFDEFLQRYDVRVPKISIVKIDVEGHENFVIRGMRRFLQEKRPRLVMFEYLQRTNLGETFSIFEDVEYTMFQLGDKGPSVVKTHAPPLQNLFACPRESMAEFGVDAAESAAP